MAKKPEQSQDSRGVNLPKIEEEVLQFWEKEKIFERSISERPADRAYVFYDGPPYATGLPHVGHLLASAMKDTVPRYMTMKGFRVERRFGWDCHGLPIEVMVEKELGLKSRKDILTMGIDKFNEICRATVLRYVKEWKRTITRFGRWVDFENDYKTMDTPYMESCLWVFSELYKKGLIYEDYRSSLYCTRCETPLSKMETAMDNSYRDVEDPSLFIAFETVDDPNTFFLAWTTTPWTLSANVALAVKEDTEYVTVQLKEGDDRWMARKLIMAKERLADVLSAGAFDVLETMAGADLIGREYRQLQPFMVPVGDAFRVVAAPFVSMEEGTGIVHIAPAFGEEDFALSKTENLPVLLTVTDAGTFLPEIKPWAGQHVKAADPSILAALETEGKLFKSSSITHSYPFCWRCDNPLIYKVQNSWYVKVSAVKSQMLETNEKIHWVPEHLKHGRFGQGVENAPDWGVSRSRFWGVPIPVWRCDRCEQEKVVGSLNEIEQLSGQRPSDLHRPVIDSVSWACSCGGTFSRISDVFDVWFDSGCMPYGQVHYPFENKEKFETTFPADFITEYIGQTRGWFYYLHVLSNALFGTAAFKHVVNTGIIQAEDGTKISKSKGNFTDPHLVFDRYGSDATRLYMLASPLMQAENLNFSDQGVEETMKKVLMPLWNVLSFFTLYAPKDGKIDVIDKPTHVLDRWILARLEETRATIEEGMEQYELWRALKPIAPFVNDLSTWFVRRSRDRFKAEDETDKQAALSTLFTVLLETSKIFAPFLPFTSEAIYQKLKPLNASTIDSVHLELWPTVHAERLDAQLLVDTDKARRVIEIGHALRSQEKIKVRQPLRRVWVSGVDVSESMREVVLSELNVWEWGQGETSDSESIKKNSDESGVTVSYDTAMDEELELEGLKREFVRMVNSERKKMGLTIHDRIKITYSTESEKLKKLFTEKSAEILKDTLADSIKAGKGKIEMKVNEEAVSVTIK